MTRISRSPLAAHAILLALAVAVSGCSVVDRFKPGGRTPEPTEAAMPAPDAGDESAAGDGAEAAIAQDSTAGDEKPADPTPGPAGKLGTTVASLGDPAEPGMWLETPLVKVRGPGQVVYQGRTADVELRPIDGPATSGSRMSLAAFQTLQVSVIDLPTIEVRRK